MPKPSAHSPQFLRRISGQVYFDLSVLPGATDGSSAELPKAGGLSFLLSSTQAAVTGLVITYLYNCDIPGQANHQHGTAEDGTATTSL